MDPLSKKKNTPQIFERRSGFKNIEQNVKDSSFWASCIARILNEPSLNSPIEAYTCNKMPFYISISRH